MLRPIQRQLFLDAVLLEGRLLQDQGVGPSCCTDANAAFSSDSSKRTAPQQRMQAQGGVRPELPTPQDQY